MSTFQTYPNYLPESKGSSEVYGTVTVKLVSQKTTTDYIVKELELSQERSLGTEAVTMFHYLRWPKHGTPRTTSTLLEIIKYLNKRQMNSGNNPITIMCK